MEFDLEEYFDEHPDEEEEFLEETAERTCMYEPVDYPDDWGY